MFGTLGQQQHFAAGVQRRDRIAHNSSIAIVVFRQQPDHFLDARMWRDGRRRKMPSLNNQLFRHVGRALGDVPYGAALHEYNGMVSVATNRCGSEPQHVT